MIPNRDAELYADRPGTEQVVMIASREPIDAPLAALDKGESGLLSAADFERMLTEKGIRVERDRRSRMRDARAEGILVKHLELEVTGEPSRLPPLSEAPTVVLGTARESYRAGERFDVVFGADEAGILGDDGSVSTPDDGSIGVAVQPIRILH